MVRSIPGAAPSLHPTARVAETAVISGAVSLAEDTNIWYHAVIRGDQNTISIGARSNIQDGCVLHCSPNFPLTVGADVTVGHGAILHGCTVEDGCLIGMGAILLNGCVIGAGSTVAAGALVTQNTVIPPNSMVMGSPAKVKRPLREDELAKVGGGAQTYVALAREQLPAAPDR